MWKEFREFAMKGNVVDLAVGVIIGGAFGKIVEAVTAAIINPLLALVVGKPDFHFGPTIKGSTFDFGLILTAILMFLMTAAVIFFLIIKPANAFMARLKKDEPAPPPAGPTNEEKLLAEIRDLLKTR